MTNYAIVSTSVSQSVPLANFDLQPLGFSLVKMVFKDAKRPKADKGYV